MANDVFADHIMFKACSAVLDAELRPIHYAELTDLALNRLGASRDDVNFARQKEDVRERMLLARQHGTSYTGAPQCYAYKPVWLSMPQGQLLNMQAPIMVASNLKASEEACFEALMRHQFMLSKGANKEAHARRHARGVLVQEHVRQWFQDRWPSFYREPTNHHEWNKPSKEDFFLNDGHGWRTFDVAGQNANGSFGSDSKKKCDYHIFAHYDDSDGHHVYINGYVLGSDFSKRNDTYQTRPIQRLAFTLNCLRLEIPLALFKA